MIQLGFNILWNFANENFVVCFLVIKEWKYSQFLMSRILISRCILISNNIVWYVYCFIYISTLAISNYWFLKVNFLGRENLLWYINSFGRFLTLKYRDLIVIAFGNSVDPAKAPYNERLVCYYSLRSLNLISFFKFRRRKIYCLLFGALGLIYKRETTWTGNSPVWLKVSKSRIRLQTQSKQAITVGLCSETELNMTYSRAPKKQTKKFM